MLYLNQHSEKDSGQAGNHAHRSDAQLAMHAGNVQFRGFLEIVLECWWLLYPAANNSRVLVGVPQIQIK